MPDPGAPKLKNKPHDSDLQTQIDGLRTVIERERQALSDAHVEPANQLREQAASLGETFITASNLALRGFERAESRLVALEQDLQGRMAQLSTDIQSVVAELRSARRQSMPPAAAAFPLEGVMRIHEELRGSDSTAVSGADALKAGLTAFSQPTPELALAPRQLTESTAALTARMESLERAVGHATAAAAQPAAAGRPLSSMVGAIAAIAAIVLFGLWMQRRVDSRLNDAAVRVTAAERQRDAATEAANSRLAATREDATRQIANARESATQAQIVGNVLAAPDLVRYWLIGAASANPRAYARVLFSRSRGMVFSASRLPVPGAGKTYQLWLLTKGGPVSAGLITPDSAGRVTFATDEPIKVPKRLTGSVLTMEPTGGRPKPSGTSVLVRVP